MSAALLATRRPNMLDDYVYKRWAALIISKDGYYVPLLVLVILFLFSLYVRPTIHTDSGTGFLVFRSMLEGSGFNMLIEPDAANIANDIANFETWWSPGQYLVPGIFVWLGTSYGVALSLTTFFSTVIGVSGWAQVARSFGVTRFVLLVFLSGLVSFRYVTLPFQMYHGGEVLLFATAPWCFYWMRYAVHKPATTCFAISLVSAALLFVAKLTGLVVFAANVLGLALFEVVQQRRLSASVLAMLTAAAVAALCFLVFWAARSSVPARGAEFSITWPAILFPLAGAAFSGVSALQLVIGKLSLPDLLARTYFLGPLGFVLLVWIWYQLRHTRYRAMATVLFGIITFYTVAIAILYVHDVRGAQIQVSFEERQLRYAGIISLLLLLVALDQGERKMAKGVALIGVGMFALYGLASYAAATRVLMRGHYYDTLSGTSQTIVSPIVLEYLRSEIEEHNWQRAIAAIPGPQPAIAIPRFRIVDVRRQQNWFGRAEKIFVIVPEWWVENGEIDKLLNSFVNYRESKWSETHIDGNIIYSQ